MSLGLNLLPFLEAAERWRCSRFGWAEVVAVRLCGGVGDLLFRRIAISRDAHN